MDDLKSIFKENFLEYASYVVLERAIPNMADGLKPVHRRILYTLKKMDDGKLHKVANVSGQTMALHPHGEAAINDALVTLAAKGYLLDQQGNFGNLYTGDPAAAPRYIETRLSPLARATLFNDELTTFVPSYDGRNKEPTVLPAKICVLLMQGSEGIAVGMSTRILPHNFTEILEAQIAVLEGKSFTLLPDFPTGGLMDATDYQSGKGKVKLRAKITKRDDKTLVIEEICHGTTTESLIRSIDEAAKKGKIKIESIHDYTASHVEIEIRLPRGQHADDLIDALYAYTECEVSLSSQVIVIADNLPLETTVDEILRLHVERLKAYLTQELINERDKLQKKVFLRTLEALFIEERLYKKLEEIKVEDKIYSTLLKSFVPYHPQLLRPPVEEDLDKLLEIPIRRISRFDIEKNRAEVAAMQERLAEIDKDLKDIKKVALRYLKQLLKDYGKNFPRKTQLQALEEVDVRSIATKNIKVYFDVKNGFIGTKVASEHFFECTNFDKILLFYNDGTYQVINIPEKQYVIPSKSSLVYAGVADKKTVMRCLYSDPKTKLCMAKRFVVTQFILDKVYRYFEEGMKLQLLTTRENPIVQVEFIPVPRQKTAATRFEIDGILVKGVSARGVRVSPRAVREIKLLEKS